MVVSAVVMAQTFQGDLKMAVKSTAALDLTPHVDGAGVGSDLYRRMRREEAVIVM